MVIGLCLRLHTDEKRGVKKIIDFTRGAGVFHQGAKFKKKGTFFVEKALPAKANFVSHAAI